MRGETATAFNLDAIRIDDVPLDEDRLLTDEEINAAADQFWNALQGAASPAA